MVIAGYDKRSMTVFLFTLASCVLFSVGILLAIHTYLTMTNQVCLAFISLLFSPIFSYHFILLQLQLQTTLELYINFDEAREAKTNGTFYKNPFDKGLRKNLRRVFGDTPWYLALLPSLREPVDPEYPFSINDYMEQHV